MSCDILNNSCSARSMKLSILSPRQTKIMKDHHKIVARYSCLEKASKKPAFLKGKKNIEVFHCLITEEIWLIVEC